VDLAKSHSSPGQQTKKHEVAQSDSCIAIGLVHLLISQQDIIKTKTTSKQNKIKQSDNQIKIMVGKTFGPPVVMGDESIMSPKAHGTSSV
jgi:hypothetical protein